MPLMYFFKPGKIMKLKFKQTLQMGRHLVFLASCLIILNVAYSQVPLPRASGHLIYFKPTKSLLLFDGYGTGASPSSGRSEVWQWKEQRWTRIDSNDQPLRSLSGAVYMNDKNEVFIYGGIGDRGYEDSLKDAFIYNGSKWKNIVDRSIGTHDHHELAYDESNKMIVVYGGQTGSRKFDTTTWLYKGDRWNALTIPSPGAKVHHAMAYDVERKKIVLYGGYNDKGATDETWEFDGKSWSKIAASANPGARGHHSMVYDPVSKRVLLFGGTGSMDAKGDVWAWNGKSWEQLSDNGPQRILPSVAFDPEKNKLYVFGGNGGESFLFIYSDLWEWNGKTWARIHSGEVYKFDMQKNMFVKTND
jgi:photosystem II stability/assembly factor-like uncharacterized protein